MRPRLIAVDNPRAQAVEVGQVAASMRPRLIAVDNAAGADAESLRNAGFNEATADCRG